MFDRFEEARARGYLDGLQGYKLDRLGKFEDRLTAYRLGYADGRRALERKINA